MPRPSSFYKPTDAERAFAGCYGACHALAAAAERLLTHQPGRTDLGFLVEVVASQLDLLEAEATERTRPVLERIARKYTRTRTTKETRR